MPFRDVSLPIAQRVDDLVRRPHPGRKKTSQTIGPRPSAHPAALDIPAYNWLERRPPRQFGALGLRHHVSRRPIGKRRPTWDASLVQQIGAVVSTEARAQVQTTLSATTTTIATTASPSGRPNNQHLFAIRAGGRGQETYGEDPFLTATLGTRLSSRAFKATIPTYLRAIGDALSTTAGPIADPNPPPRSRRPILPSTDLLGQPTSPRLSAAHHHRWPRPTPSCAPTTRIDKFPACGSPNAPRRTILRKDWKFDGYVHPPDCDGRRRFLAAPHGPPLRARQRNTAPPLGRHCRKPTSTGGLPPTKGLTPAVPAQPAYSSANSDVTVKRPLHRAHGALGHVSIRLASVGPLFNDSIQRRQLHRETPH